MSGQLLKVCALAVICVEVGAVINQIKRELSFAVRCAGSILIFGMIVISLEPLLAELGSVRGLEGSGEYVEIMLKALGVAILTQICSGICRDCGENGISAGVEFAGKTEILILCLPLIKRILQYAAEILSIDG